MFYAIIEYTTKLMYILGIDGGGTKTKVSLIDHLGNFIGCSTKGPSSIDTVTIDVSLANIKAAVNDILQKNNLTDVHITSVFAGLGGISSDSHKDLVVSSLKKLDCISPTTIVKCDNDVYNAFAGGSMGKASITIVIGTGSVAFGVDEANKSFRVGGYSYKEGDTGSSFDLGRQTLKTLARVLDKRYRSSAFIEQIKKDLNVFSFSQLVSTLNQFYENRTKTASLAKIVTRFADLGDYHALRIIEQATDELALMVKTVNQNINLLTVFKISTDFH